MESEVIKSPCVKRCKYDEFDLCIGCYRTKQEIVLWSDFSNTEKLAVLQKVEQRRKPGMKYQIK
jgi:predicted Fe-S protein YdhL (DUF1289 family)